MIINLSPIRMDEAVVVAIQGDVLTVNGADYDFSQLEEGGVLPRAAANCPELLSDVTRLDGEIILTLVLPYRSDAPEAVRFPQPIHTTEDGPIRLPGAEV